MSFLSKSVISKDYKSVLHQPWFAAVLLVALAPALHAVATWDLDGRLSSSAYALRHYSYVIVVVEICVTWLALRNNMSVSHAFAELPKSVKVLLALWFVFSLAALFSTTNGLSNAVFTLARYVIHGLFLISMVHLLKTAAHKDKRVWLEILSAGTVIYLIILVIFCILVPKPNEFPWVYRVPSATNIRQIANNAGMLAIAPIALLLAVNRRHFFRYAMALMIVLAFVSWTGSRATLLGLITGIMCGIVTVRKFTCLRNVILCGVTFLSAITMSLALPVPDPSLGLVRLVKASDVQEDPTSGRSELWIQTSQQIFQSPWIGYGSGRFRDNMGAQYGTVLNHPHNFILQYLYDWGFIGGVIALLLLAILGVKIWQKREADPIYRFMAISAYVTICSTAMIDSPLFHPLPIMIALTLIAPVFARSEHRPHP